MDKMKIYMDQPIEKMAEDRFGFNDYVELITKVITNEDTETPLSIGIFGGWGSGKTTLMKLIHGKLKDNSAFGMIWFDAWKYEHETTLWTPLMQLIITEMERVLKVNKDGIDEVLYTKGIKLLKKVGKSLINIGLSKYTGYNLNDLKELITEKKEDHEDPFNPYYELISDYRDLHEDFQQLIGAYLDALKVSKMIIFIDDVDRCLPNKALEMLNALRNFFNANGCIFIVGIDDDVINNYVLDRYKTESSQIGSEYVDKIVQISIRLHPINIMKIESYLNELIDNKDLFNEIGKLIIGSVEKNPRKIKRLLNDFMLSRELARIRGLLYTSIQENLLVKILILQHEWNEIYNDIVNNPSLIKTYELLADEYKQFDDDDINLTVPKPTGLVQRKLRSESKVLIQDERLMVFLKTVPRFQETDIQPYIEMISFSSKYTTDEDIDLSIIATNEEIDESIQKIRDANTNAAKQNAWDLFRDLCFKKRTIFNDDVKSFLNEYLESDNIDNRLNATKVIELILRFENKHEDYFVLVIDSFKDKLIEIYRSNIETGGDGDLLSRVIGAFTLMAGFDKEVLDLYIEFIKEADEDLWKNQYGHWRHNLYGILTGVNGKYFLANLEDIIMSVQDEDKAERVYQFKRDIFQEHRHWIEKGKN